MSYCPGLGFDEADQQRPTRAFSGGWRYVLGLKVMLGADCRRMRLALARALFVKVSCNTSCGPLILYSGSHSQPFSYWMNPPITVSETHARHFLLH